MVQDRDDAQSGAGGLIVRHKLPDRVLHWTSAACVLLLLGTAFLPILGVKFEWVTIHWIAGLVLLATVVLHVLRTIQRRQFASMWLGLKDIKLAASYLRRGAAQKPGKYSPAQKLMHLGVTVLVTTTIVTGLVMMMKIDTPFWERNIYLLDDTVWGVVYILHGLSALSLVTTVMLHIYFALRPEKLLYTRSMIRGWITKAEFLDHHDADKWQVDHRE